LAGYFGLNYIWRWSVVKAWQLRQAKYAAKKAKLKQPQ
jgi:hypothetical protein